MMNDFISETSYSPRPRLSPLATASPRYTDSELSPRRSFVPSSSQSRLLSSYDLSSLISYNIHRMQACIKYSIKLTLLLSRQKISARIIYNQAINVIHK